MRKVQKRQNEGGGAGERMEVERADRSAVARPAVCPGGTRFCGPVRAAQPGELQQLEGKVEAGALVSGKCVGRFALGAGAMVG